MAKSNDERTLSFSTSWISSTVVESVSNLSIEDAVVVNLATTPASFQAGDFRGTIPPFQSKQLKNCIVTSADRVGVFTLRQSENLGGLALVWDWFGKVYAEFNRETPLYVSPQDEIAELEFNPAEIFSFDGSKGCHPLRFKLKLNLWYAPALTDCGIHNEHSFLEVHTQLAGTGRMQKFRAKDASTKFEDLIVSPGATHEPFFQYSPASGFQYPMHRYFSQTDCVWMAIEFHPL